MTESGRPLVAMVLPPGEGFSPDAVGAIGLVVRDLARHAQHMRACVVGAPPSGARFPDIEFHPVQFPTWLPLGTNQRYRFAVGALLHRLQPAWVDVHNRVDLAAALARNWPVRLFLHNDPRRMRGARHPVARARLIRRGVTIIAISTYLRDAFMQGVPADLRPPVVVPNGIDLEHLPPPAARERLILFAGRVVADKGADGFVAACARALPALPGWRAALVGADRFRADAPETPFTRALRPAADAAGIAWLGHRDHDDVLALMARAALVVVPSRWPEPFGMVALEAMASGAPLLCSLRGGLSELAHGVAEPVDPDLPDQMAASIIRLANDPAARGQMSMAGRVRAADYGIDRIIARLEQHRPGFRQA